MTDYDDACAAESARNAALIAYRAVLERRIAWLRKKVVALRRLLRAMKTGE